MTIHPCHVDLHSALKGLLAMRFKRRPKHPHDYKKAEEMLKAGIPYGAGWAVDVGNFGWGIAFWTPTWHEGRGPYLSILLGRIRICRGY